MRFRSRMKPIYNGTLLLLGVVACAGEERARAGDEGAAPVEARPAAESRPRFEDYPVGEVSPVRPVPVDLASHPDAREFRTMLRRGAAEGPNFAGYYTVVTWGCGTMCQQTRVVDARTGRVFEGPVAALGVDYRLDSRLLVVNPPERARLNPCPECATAYYVWEEEGLRRIPEEWTDTTMPPPGSEELVTGVRGAEEPLLLRRYAPAVVRPSWDRLVITAEDGSRHTFDDWVVEQDLRTVHRFAGRVEGIDAYLVERRYVPEGGEFLLVDARTGRTMQIDAPPVASPDGRRFVTASLDLVAGHAPNRIRIYRVETGAPVLEWEMEPKEWGARNPAWLDAGTLRLERGDLDPGTYEVRTSTMVMRLEGGRWTM